MARRAASIWRAVRRSGSIALRPNEPKSRLNPPLAAPLIRPLKALRYLVRLGDSMMFLLRVPLLGAIDARRRALRRGLFGALVVRHRVVRHDLALEHPDLHAASAEGREGGRDAVVDVGAQRVQRHATFAIPLHTGDFRTAETARAIDADAAGAKAHGRLHGALHGTTERNAALELLGDVLGDQRGVDLGLADLDDVQGHFTLGHLGEVAAQLLDVGALLADHDARTGGVDRDAGALGRTLDDDLGNTRLVQALVQNLADLDVLVEHRRIFRPFGVPARVPGPVDAETQADRIYLLTHFTFPPPRGAHAPRW